MRFPIKFSGKEVLPAINKDGRGLGLPDLSAGKRVDLSGVGSRFSGRYFVTKVRHRFGESNYSTKFEAKRPQDCD